MTRTSNSKTSFKESRNELGCQSLLNWVVKVYWANPAPGAPPYQQFDSAARVVQAEKVKVFDANDVLIVEPIPATDVLRVETEPLVAHVAQP